YLLNLLASAGLPSLSNASPEALEAPAEMLLDRIEQELGSGQPAGQRDERARTPAEEKVAEEAHKLASSLSRRTLEWLLEMVETPGNRIKAADFAANQFTQHLKKASHKARERLARLQKRRESARLRLFPTSEPNASPSATWLRAKRRKNKLESVQRDFLEYSRLRLFEINHENEVYVLVAVHEQLNCF